MSTIIGTSNADSLRGTTGVDSINAGAGADVITGAGGADTIDGGTGNDRIFWTVGDGSDVVEGGADVDEQFLTGAAGADSFTLSASGGHVLASDGAETLDIHGVEEISLQTLGGADNIQVGDLSTTEVRTLVLDAGAADAQADVVGLTGAAANDVISVQVFSASALRVGDAANGVVTTTVISSLGAEDQLSVNGGAGADTIAVTSPSGAIASARFVIAGGAGDDTLTGAAENDIFAWSSSDGSDKIDGGLGQDAQTLTTGDAADQVSIAQNGVHVTEQIGSSAIDMVGVETINLKPQGGADTIRVGDLSQTDVRALNIDLTGSNGAPDNAGDSLSFNGQDDVTINGSADGTSMDMSFTARSGIIVEVNVTGLDSTDHVTFVGTSGDDGYNFLRTPLHNVTFDLGQGDDGVQGGLGNSSVNAGDGDDQIVGGSGRDIVHDTIDGGAGDDAIFDSGRFDLLEGGSGNDTIGDAGSFDFSPSMNTIQGGNGDDQITSFGRNDSISGGDGDDSITAFESGQTVSGGQGNDAIALNAFTSTASGGDGNDTLTTTDQFGSALHGDAGDDQFQIGITFHENAGLVNSSFDGGTGIDALNVITDPLDQFQFGGAWLDTLSAKTTASGVVAELNLSHTFVDALGDVLDLKSGMDMQAVEVLNFPGSTGADHIVVGDLTGTGLSLINIDLGPPGLADSGGVFLTPTPPGPDGVQDLVNLNGSAAADHVVVSEFGNGGLQISGLPETVRLFDMDVSARLGGLKDLVSLSTGAGDDAIDLTNMTLDHGMTVDAGAGNDTITAGSAPTVFQFTFGHDRIDHFSVSQDAVHLTHLFNSDGVPDLSVADMVADGHIFQVGANVMISDGTSHFLTLTNVNLGSLSDSNFIFGV